MARVIRPRIREQAGIAASGAGDDWSGRLLSYIPLTISGAYPVLDNALSAYASTYAKPPTPDASVSPRTLGVIVFGALIIYSIVELHLEYNKKQLSGYVRKKLQTLQTIVMAAAFMLWTYSIRGSIWGTTYNAALALILCILFMLGTRYLPPMGITLNEARQSGFDNLLLKDQAQQDKTQQDQTQQDQSQKDQIQKD